MSAAIRGIDWKLLRKQKLHLMEVIGNSNVTNAQSESLEGILSLLDSIQDEAETEKYASTETIFGSK